MLSSISDVVSILGLMTKTCSLALWSRSYLFAIQKTNMNRVYTASAIRLLPP